jgi:triacylglycerol lipase
MSSFDPQFAHDILLLLAEAAYVADPTKLNLPPNYSLVGQIAVDPAQAAALSTYAALLPGHRDLITRMRAESDVFGWVVENTQTKTLAVSFRGTSNAEDWLKDFDIFPTPYKPVANYGTVHQGFQEVYLAVADSVRALVQKATAGFTRLILTGHSLGAAVAVVAAPDGLHNFGLNVAPEVQNFAGPRAGHRDFASNFDVDIDVCFRVVNQWDLVPHVPPTLALFEHAGLAVRVDGGFTLDEFIAHSLPQSYGPGLLKLYPQAGAQLKTLIGREP